MYIEVGKEKIKIIFKPASTTDELVVSQGKDHLVATVGGAKSFLEIHDLLKKKFAAFRKPINFYVNQTFPVYPNALLRDIYEKPFYSFEYLYNRIFFSGYFHYLFYYFVLLH